MSSSSAAPAAAAPWAVAPRTLLAGRAAWLDTLLYGTNEKLVLAKNVIVLIALVRFVGPYVGLVYDRGLFGVLKIAGVALMNKFFRTVKRIPFVRAKIDQELGKVMRKVEHDVAPTLEGVPAYVALPAHGLPQDEVDKQLDKLATFTHKAVEQGRVSGAVYHGGEELSKLTNRAYARFSLSNPLHPDLFPGVRKMEAEIVSMVVKMYNGGPDACGTTTSGGTESILMACKTMRDWARDVKGITEPEMVIPVSAHAAFDKAGHYFKIKVLHAPLDPVTMKVDVKAVRRMVTRNTIMVRPARRPSRSGAGRQAAWLTCARARRGGRGSRDRASPPDCRLGAQLPARRRRRHPGARPDCPPQEHRPARRLLPRRLPRAVHGEGRLPDAAGRLPRAGRHQHLVRYAQVRLRAQGLLRRHVPLQEPAPLPVLCHHRLARRHLRVAGHRRLAARLPHRRLLGRHGPHGRGRLRRVDQADCLDHPPHCTGVRARGGWRAPARARARACDVPS